MSVTIPTIETERLRLRGHTVDDFPSCAALWADEGVTRFIGGKPQTSEEAWSRLLRYVGHWALLGYGFWLIEEKATGAFVGEVGFAEFKRQIEPTIDVPEAGWVLSPAMQGRGYATEALRGAIDWLGRPAACIIHPENAASVRVAEKAGFRQAGMVSYKGMPTVFMRFPGGETESGRKS
jgi:RimJ/RimL family protein N-acetyltransferase